MPRLEPGKLVAATHNRGKVSELKDLFEPHGFEVISALELGLDEPDETEDSFSGNALLKARAAARATGAPALSDDSGLSVTALGGQPGIYSARWAGEPRDFYKAMERVEAELKSSGSTDRSAKFVCALAVVWPDGTEAVYEGEVHGELVWPPRGEKGFGYDPVFVADGETLTFGEMDPARKHGMSHRARAVEKLRAALLP
ncbi:RdgB/HAM1 family non-canonical purine NTP pyrophosphatase [Hyphomonas sp. WL0036]|uniref:RdgB/HAM1 family non-canonical purine NTP pyrophosphatase n=1 Tax=Hyphomonas sediminis TaxID=2866160 RepID=UPI001C7F98B2|nr:RdgB/HAM1 family non-canonical purine NTP pyrophosphatase [Hyphomonas sediminis]MBY9066263.1 RdgB/HAM1 family non-canonical purine NTP pyrophosphatase [Hyphomonas sediminis]